MSPNYLFSTLCLLWIGSELWLGRRRRSDDRTRDSGTLRLLLITVYVCVGLAIWIASSGLGPYPPGLREALLWAGIVLMGAGLALRWWSIRVLAHFFTIDVAIRPDHELIRSGPYRLLRHPSYTGALMTFYGFSLALGDVWSLPVVVVPVTIAFLWRIRIEERVLSSAFAEQYAQYARETKRLIPYVW